MTERYRWILLLALSIMVLIINVDYTAVNLALIPMATELHADIDTIQWVLSGYVLAWALLVIPAGKYADKHSKRHFCLVGLSLFLLASLLAGLANTVHLLIAARILQGFAGGIYVPTMYALIYINFAEHERGRAIGLMSLGVGLGMAIGPFVGGVLLSAFNWRSIFLINIPIGLIALAIIYRSKKDENINKTAQSNASNALIPLALFKNLPFLGVIIGILLEQFAFSTIIVVLGLFLQKVLLFSTLKSSIVYLALTIIFGVIAYASGPWIDRVGLRKPTALGLAGLTLGSFLFLLLTPATQLWFVCIVLVVLGCGMGMAFAGLNTGVVKTVQENYIGVGSSVFLICALLGNSLGITITTFVYQQASLSKLLHLLNAQNVITSQLQIHQIADYIANIGAQSYSLNALSNELQTVVYKNITMALNYGVSNVMLMNAMVCLIATIVCASLLKKR